MTETMKRIGERWRGWLHGVVGWLRWKLTKRRRVIGYDVGVDADTWCLVEYDGRTGIYTLLDHGSMPRTKEPANDR